MAGIKTRALELLKQMFTTGIRKNASSGQRVEQTGIYYMI